MKAFINRLNIEQKESFGRGYFIDNLRFILIFSVVLGHLLEFAAPFKGSIFLYKTIYSFHMPAFLFLFGYFIRFNRKRLVFHWILPYLVFQTIYIFFHRMILEPEVTLQYTMPYWALWYMMVCIFYQVLLPIVDVSSKRKQLFILASSICAALYIGFDSTVGYFLALSRTIVFLPWFLIGFYFRKNGGFDSLFRSKKVIMKYFSVSLFIGLLSSIFIYKSNVSVNLLFGASSYSACGETMWTRLITMIIAFNWIVLLYTFAKLFLNFRIPFITNVGQCTLPVFLLHGFIIKSIFRYGQILVSTPLHILLMTLLILIILGNKWMKKLIYYLGFSWLERL